MRKKKYTASVNGIETEVRSDKVVIYDTEGVVSDDYAVSIITYLREEGFIEDITVTCEIIVGE